MNVLVLTASYGAGHNSAAQALGEEFARAQIPVQVVDALALEPSLSYPLSRAYYKFCVEHAAWLWGLTFEATDKADWTRLVKTSFFKSVRDAITKLIIESNANFIIATYPLFSFILDEIRLQHKLNFRHVAVVTDAIEISRPWIRSGAERVFVTDEYSAAIVALRYALSTDVLQVSSFPTSARFLPCDSLSVPSEKDLRILYAAQAPSKQCIDELVALLKSYPNVHITILAGSRFAYVNKMLASYLGRFSIKLIERSDAMAALMRSHHLYIGKPGGATVFECYASALPMVINFALMGQEQGNLDLLERDGCAYYVCGADALVALIGRLLSNQSQEWKHMRTQMLSLPRRGGAARVREACEQIFKQPYDRLTR